MDDARVKLYVGTGYIEMPASEVARFEADETPSPAPAPEPPPSAQVETSVPPAPPPASPAELADAAADKYGLPRLLVRSVMAAESGFQPDAVSPKGAIGLMQLMPETAQTLGADPRDPAQNVDAGVRYLSDLLNRYHFGLWQALAAYNAGPGAVDKYQGVPPYRETIDYVKRIDRAYEGGSNR
jgi:soluble lytic murein transglycosylase-like protein